MSGDQDEDVTLRAKYHDWCSAQIVDRFLELTPEEVYRLAHEGREPSAGELAAAGYSDLVDRVTEGLARSLKLPAFAEWSAAYRDDPERFEDLLLGFWRLDAEGGGPE